jgi:TRAP-type C4-dicarboxylate transport system permease small subunit
MQKKLQKSKKKQNKLHVAVLTQIVTLATSGFGLVAALAWNNVIQELVNNYIKKLLPTSYGIVSLLIYAVIITILAVIITTELTRLVERVENSKD